MDWFLYDNGLHHERVKDRTCRTFLSFSLIHGIISILVVLSSVLLHSVLYRHLLWHWNRSQRSLLKNVGASVKPCRTPYLIFFSSTVFVLCIQFRWQPCINPLSANFTKWSNTLKQFVGKFSTNCLSVFGHFVGLALKGLTILYLTHDLASWQ